MKKLLLLCLCWITISQAHAQLSTQQLIDTTNRRIPLGTPTATTNVLNRQLNPVLIQAFRSFLNKDSIDFAQFVTIDDLPTQLRTSYNDFASKYVRGLWNTAGDKVQYEIYLREDSLKGLIAHVGDSLGWNGGGGGTGVTDGDKGDVVVSGSGATWTVQNQLPLAGGYVTGPVYSNQTSFPDTALITREGVETLLDGFSPEVSALTKSRYEIGGNADPKGVGAVLDEYYNRFEYGVSPGLPSWVVIESTQEGDGSDQAYRYAKAGFFTNLNTFDTYEVGVGLVPNTQYYLAVGSSGYLTTNPASGIEILYTGDSEQEITVRIRDVRVASSTQPGLLSAADWINFNSKPSTTYVDTQRDTRLAKSSNLSDLTSASTARTNLGIGTLGTQNGTFSTTGINTLYGFTITDPALKVPTTRTVNGQALSSDITLTTTNIGEGTRLYFTEPRVRNAILSNYSSNSGAYANGDSLQTFANKTKYQIETNAAAIATNTINIALKGNVAGQAWTGTHTFPTQTATDNSTKGATTAYVKGQNKLAAPIGIVLADDFVRGSLGSSYTATTGTGGTVNITSNKLHLVGPTSGAAYQNKATYNVYTSGMREGLTVVADFVATTMTASTSFGLFLELTSQSGLNATSEQVLLNLQTNNPPNGELFVARNGTTYHQQSTTERDAIESFSVAQGDRIILSVTFTAFGGTVTARNVTQNKLNAYTWDYGISTNRTTANCFQVSIGSQGGTQDVTSFSVIEGQLKNPHFCFVTNSIGQGYGANKKENRWIDRLMAGSHKSYTVISIQSGRTAEFLQIQQQILDVNADVYVFAEPMGNDISSGVSSGTWQANYSTLASAVISAGHSIIHLPPDPRNTTDMSGGLSWLNSTYSGVAGHTIIDTYTPLKDASTTNVNNLHYGDGTHINSTGHAKKADVIAAAYPGFYQ